MSQSNWNNQVSLRLIVSSQLEQSGRILLSAVVSSHLLVQAAKAAALQSEFSLYQALLEQRTFFKHIFCNFRQRAITSLYTLNLQKPTVQSKYHLHLHLIVPSSSGTMDATAAANALALPPNTPFPPLPPTPSLPGDFLFDSYVGRECLKIFFLLSVIVLVLIVVGYMKWKGIR
ncbi:hypothetical protein NA56DRAFT_707918 [Hyaloscypha hepaticicola]|uniref:Uncharacterized protein n=1 Tax=Hyaloscypha hepaticicola TaxID=2082293 RepID=A0A2J6PTN1_9HELO|nr:hypothetical protein NA56DRAFT_707918 [Hyaloscypha hepaticicola]